jgi:hypothetical protein
MNYHTKLNEPDVFLLSNFIFLTLQMRVGAPNFTIEPGRN